MVISPLQKCGPPSQRYGGRFFLPLTARDFSLRVTYPFCGVGLHADTVDSRTCPPEGGRYMTPDTDVRVSTSHTITAHTSFRRAASTARTLFRRAPHFIERFSVKRSPHVFL